MNILLILGVAMFVAFALIGTLILCLPSKVLGDLQAWFLGTSAKDRKKTPEEQEDA